MVHISHMGKKCSTKEGIPVGVKFRTKYQRYPLSGL